MFIKHLITFPLNIRKQIKLWLRFAFETLRFASKQVALVTIRVPGILELRRPCSIGVFVLDSSRGNRMSLFLMELTS